jgi:hypothetical protein
LPLLLLFFSFIYLWRWLLPSTFVVKVCCHCYLDVNIIKGTKGCVTTTLNYNFIFLKKSQEEHNKLDFHFFPFKIPLFITFHCSKLYANWWFFNSHVACSKQLSQLGFFLNNFFLYQMCTIPLQNWKVSLH